MHWTFECFQDARFRMRLFARDNQRKLRLSALHDLMKSPDGSDFVLDFIEAQHDILEKPFDMTPYYRLTCVGALEGACEGCCEGASDGALLGCPEGASVGASLGACNTVRYPALLYYDQVVLM